MLTDIKKRYGSYKGLAKHLVFQSAMHMGRYRYATAIDWQRVDRVVFVCLGNICRSAYAEACLRRLAYATLSCGTHAIAGRPAEPAAVLAAATRGHDLASHRATPVEALKFGDGDLVVAMEPKHLEPVRRRFGAAQLTLLGLWSEPPRARIQDPYGLDAAYFDTCFSIIEQAVGRIHGLLPAPAQPTGSGR